MKYSVLTFIINNYEPVREINFNISLTPDVEYILVTDNPNLTSNTWKIIYEPELNNPNLSVMDKLLLIRYNPFKYVSNDICVRMDGSMQIMKPLDYFVENLIKNDYVGSILLHPCRDDIRDESRAWHLLRNVSWEEIYENYHHISLFLNYNYDFKGLYQTGFSIVKNNYIHNVINNLMLSFTKMNNNHCSRIDQIFYTCLINTHFLTTKWMILTGNIFNGEYITMYEHNTNKPVKQEHIIDYIFRNKPTEIFY